MRPVETGVTPRPICRPSGICVVCDDWRTWLTQGLIEQIGENPACLLEAIGADVGQVVGNDVNLHLLGSEAGTGGPQ
jgi:hypothetical protein